MKSKKTFIIAEAGVNHNGDLNLAKKMIDAAFESGVDAVKFQTFIPELVISRFTDKAPYQIKSTTTEGNMLDMVRPLQLDAKAHYELFRYCSARGIKFLSTPYDVPSVDLLCDLGVDVFKIPSADIVHLPLLRKIGGLKKKVIMSTGMSDMSEIGDAIEVLVNAGTRKQDITLMHCHTDYPTLMEDVNLLVMITLRKAFDIDVGYSDHTVGIEVPIVAVALGATTIEKHFTLDRTMQGPDHSASLEATQLKEMVSSIRNIEQCLGDGIKRISERERKNLKLMRRSIVAARDIFEGESFNEQNIAVKRPGTGISPMCWDDIIGRVAIKDFLADQLIELE